MLISKKYSSLRKLLALCALLLAGASPLFAQVLDDIIYTVGTTRNDGSGRNWAYILWQGATPDLLQNKHFAIYAKPGNAASLNPYIRQAVTSVQTEPATIQVILNRAVNLGENLGELENRINTLFQKIVPPGTNLAAKISIVIRGSLDDPNHFNNLIVMAHLHPSISMCLGMAHATILAPGDTTFEVREYDLTNSRDLGVVGRVTVQQGVAIELPQPGSPVAVPDTSAKGDLNVHFRWATPDDLRRLSLLNYGFNIYRIRKAFAEVNNFHTTPPTPAQLLTLSGNTNITRLNNNPILKNKDYTVATALNLALDPTNSFFADDNRRYEPGGVPHKNGDQYYYYVAARDVLGRNGKLSPATLVTICDRLPPNAPNGVTVLNDYHFIGGVSKQVLKVRWKQDAGTNDTVKNYYVYRWAGPDQVQAQAANPALHRIAGPIPHVVGQQWNTYVDDGAGAPSMPADASKTFWYTVRAEDNSACGGNLSANSGPAFGVLRDRTGPDAPGGYVLLICRHPVVTNEKGGNVADRDPQNETLAYYNFICTRQDAGIVWAEFYAMGLDQSNYVGRVNFSASDNTVNIRLAIPRSQLSQREISFYCRAGAIDGKISNYAIQTFTTAAPYGAVQQIVWSAKTEAEKYRPTANRKTDCFRHDPTGPGGTGDPGTITPIDVVITLTPGTKEYKLYRRVDFGKLTLVKQGPADFDVFPTVLIPDDGMPPNAGTICYYAQLFDEHGNASPMTLVGDECHIVAGTTPLPAPMLANLEIQGTETTPKMNIKWFCPPYGVERFLIHISVDPPPIPASIAPQLSDYLSSTPLSVTYKHDGETRTNDFWTYRTPRIGPGFGDGAQFEIQVSVVEGKNYTVFIEAVGVDSKIGPPSNVEDGKWTPAIVVGPKVPWPARPLPPLNIFSTNLLAERLPPSVYDGTAVRIGWIQDRVQPTSDKGPPIIFSGQDPMTYLHTNALGDKLFPVVMYRVQLANTAFPTVSGDVIQVTPLMESIAYSRDTNANGGVTVTIKDPFIVASSPPAGTNLPITPMYLIDTQPVVAGARYLYLLARMDPNHEIKEVVISSLVEVTP